MPTARLVFVTELRRLNMIKCCYKCTDERHVGCHATCEKYATEKAEHDKKREERYKGVQVMYGYRRMKDEKIKRKMHRR